MGADHTFDTNVSTAQQLYRALAAGELEPSPMARLLNIRIVEPLLPQSSSHDGADNAPATPSTST